MFQKRQFYRKQLPSLCIDFTSNEGKVIFSEALLEGGMNVFFKLCAQFRTQDEPAYCGLSSLIMALNTLEIDPGRIWKGPWRWYHEEMLDCCTSLDLARKIGINMEQFLCLARCNGLTARARSPATISSLEELRQDVLTACSRDDTVFIASFSRKVLQQSGDGHFSPIAGYHKERDLVLILDTARFKYPPYWISLQALFDAMNTLDSVTGKLRGYILLSRADSNPSSLLFQPSHEFAVDAVQGSIYDKLKVFAQEWFKWMKSPMMEEKSENLVMGDTVSFFLNLMSRGLIPVNLFSSTFECCRSKSSKNTFATVKCAAPETTNGKAVKCALHTLLSEFVNLKTYTWVRDILATNSIEVRANILNLLQHDNQSNLQSQDDVVTLKKASCHDNYNFKKSEKDCETCSSHSNIPSTCEDLMVTSEHVMTLFLLVWPHQGLWNVRNDNGDTTTASPSTDDLPQTIGDKLNILLSQDVETCEGLYIKTEIEAVKYKLEEVMKYHGFNRLSCCLEGRCLKRKLNSSN